MDCPICRKLLAHLTRLAVSRARFKLGSRIEISRAMIPITTSNSTRVNPREVAGAEPLVLHERFIRSSFGTALHSTTHGERSYGSIDMIAVSYSMRRRPLRSRMHQWNVTWVEKRAGERRRTLDILLNFSAK